MTWRALLDDHVSPHARRAAVDALAALAERLPTSGPGDPEGPDQLAELLLTLESESDSLVGSVRERREELRSATSGPSRRVVLERILRQTSDMVSADHAALDRWLDAEAIYDRDRLSLHRSFQQRQLAAEALFTWLQRGASLGSVALGLCDRLAVWARDVQRPWLLRVAYVHLAGEAARFATEPTTPQMLRELALHEREAWVQVAALEACARLRPDDTRRLAAAVLLPTEEALGWLAEDHRFVRGRAVWVCASLSVVEPLVRVLTAPDPSEHVRQQAIRAWVSLDVQGARAWLDGRTEESWRVRAGGWLAQVPETLEAGIGWVGSLAVPLRDEVLEVRGLLVGAILERRGAMSGLVAPEWTDGLTELAGRDDAPDVAEAAALLLRWLGVQGDAPAREALAALEAWCAVAREGQRRDFGPPLSGLDEEGLLDVLCVAASDGLDLSAERRGARVRVFFGARRRLALWRFLYELATPAPDKRQAFNHASDERLPGRLQAPSRRLAEVTPTRVPGMRVATTETLDWGSHLPLPAQLVQAAHHVRTEVVTPRHRLTLHRSGRRWPVWWRAQRRYVAIDAVRRAQVSRGAEGITLYDREVDAMGLKVQRHNAGGAWPEVAALVAEAVRADSNTLGDLAVVATALLAGWTLRSLAIQRSVRGHRRAVPLVVGGWGSRGKSGTERLKAGLFHGLGYRVVAKTTGCEAMFIASVPGTDPVEVFLFRPFDKATIVEQRTVLRMAAALGAQVMTWECMALRPSFVDVLQRQWMRDDLSTVTNTYPDHEDIQGPSGRDVAGTIAGFLPKRGVAFSTEQHMHPVLEQEARAVGTALHAVRPERWLLLPDDLMSRFPYQAHPRNVALVLAVSSHLGIPDDLALHRMADCVVADLGVLKEYGPIGYRERVVSFVNGCSANERAGFLSNWRRMGLGDVTEGTGLTDRLAIVFNNRADRLARQKVFARIAVHDASADAMVLIGTNVGSFATDYRDGLQSDLRPALLARIQPERPEDRGELLQAIVHHLRRPALDPVAAVSAAVAHVGEAHRALLLEAVEGPLVRRRVEVEGSPEEVAAQWVREVTWLHALLADPAGFVPEVVVDELLALLEARLVPLSDPGLSGDQVLHAIASTAPQGSTLRILGAENIKGTGLDFVYRWISVDRTLGALQRLSEADGTAQARAALAVLSGHADWGLVDLEHVSGALEALEGPLRLLGVEAETAALRRELERRATERADSLSAGRKAGLSDRVLAVVEAWLDPIDSVRRRRKAEQLYADLEARRVGTKRAALVAKKLTSRQKGGWLRWRR